MDLSIFFFAAFGVAVFGIGKGGFAGPISIMSFVMNPIQAAGILLPLLVLMDVMALYIYWKKWRTDIIKIIIPASIIGIIIGSLTFQYTSENQIRLVVGIISILFVIISLIQKNDLALKPTKIKGIFWSSTAGYTSFLIHAGAPPMNFYIKQFISELQLLLTL